jgi:Lysyl oxidase/WD40-like Beta Propeller Repeat
MAPAAGPLALLLAAAVAQPAPTIVLARDGDLYAGSRRLTRTAAIESEPALAPDGSRIAFVRDGRVVVGPVSGTKRAVGPPATSPAWSPDGKRLLVAAADGLRSVDVARGASELLGSGTEPAWARDGRIAFVLDGRIWIGETPVGPGESPAFATDGRLAFERDGQIWVGEAALTEGAEPAWSPDGTRIAFVRGGEVWTIGADGADERRVGRGIDPSWGVLAPRPPPKPDPNELLPDLDQRAPSALTVTGTKLGFTSATDNVGLGPLWIRGFRLSMRTPTMTAHQLVRLRRGGSRIVRNVGVLRYTWSSSHTHWHLLRFQQYELRRAPDFSLVVRDRKTGFCLADHYGLAAHRIRNFPGPRFLGNCGQGEPELLSVEQGTSIGFTDRYPAHFHGQSLELAGIPAGIYVLVHRGNASNRIRERTLANNAASVRLRLRWRAGVPVVRVLRVCEGSERC